ncbi:catalytic activity protein [[Candida] boidinii]|nr:catalytic activity protein [[Candida] boidinii]
MDDLIIDYIQEAEKGTKLTRDTTINNNNNNNNIKIPIIISHDKAFLFDLNHIEQIRREYGIIGILSGTLPIAPQQNILLGLPLQLSIDEILYLIINNVCYLINNKDLIQDKYFNSMNYNEKSRLEKNYNDLILKQIEIKKLNYLNNLKNRGIDINKLQKSDKNNNNNNNNKSDKIGFYIETLNSTDNYFSSNKIEFSQDYEIQKRLLNNFIKTVINTNNNNTIKMNKKLKILLNDFLIFNYLKQNYNQCILPGIRFGGNYVSYPGDILKYHSHFIVNTRDYYKEDINLSTLSNGGRLATGVKKLWLISGMKEGDVNEERDEITNESGEDIDVIEFLKNDKRVCKCFTIEWSGFG